MTAISLMDALVLRPIRPEDIDAVHAIEDISFANPWPLSSYHFEVLENKASRPLLAEVTREDMSKQVVGMIIPWLLVDEVHIANIAVSPEYRRQGIACQLMQTALLDCVQQGAVSASLEVRASNLAAQALYARFGFETVGRRKAYYHDNREDALLMTVEKITARDLSLVDCQPA